MLYGGLVICITARLPWRCEALGMCMWRQKGNNGRLFGSFTAETLGNNQPKTLDDKATNRRGTFEQPPFQTD
jgi:hypothetical protein